MSAPPRWPCGCDPFASRCARCYGSGWLEADLATLGRNLAVAGGLALAWVTGFIAGGLDVADRRTASVPRPW